MTKEQKIALVMSVVRAEGDVPAAAYSVIEMAIDEVLSISESLRSIATTLEIMSNQGPRQ